MQNRYSSLIYLDHKENESFSNATANRLND